jgi:hypothetical protein
MADSPTIEIWLRGTEAATSEAFAPATPPNAWTDTDVEWVLKAMLRALDRRKNPDADERQVFLRGFSWIVSPSKAGGVVIALEMQVGAVMAGPFEIAQQELNDMIGRVMEQGKAQPYKM